MALAQVTHFVREDSGELSPSRKELARVVAPAEELQRVLHDRPTLLAAGVGHLEAVVGDLGYVEHTDPDPAVLVLERDRAAAVHHGDGVGERAEHEVAPGVVVKRTGGHTPGHSVVYVKSGNERLTFAGDALFPVAFDHPDWQNGFEHDPEEAVRVRVRLLQEAAASGEWFVATHLSFPSVGRVAVDGDAFRWVAGSWDY